MAAFTFTLVTKVLAASGCAATACRDDQAFAWLAEACGSTSAPKDPKFSGELKGDGAQNNKRLFFAARIHRGAQLGPANPLGAALTGPSSPGAVASSVSATKAC